MKRNFKIIVLSLAIVLLLNIILFSILTVYQVPYYDEAPFKMDSIYELYASDEFNDVHYRGALKYLSEGSEIQKIEELFKSTSIVKLNIIKSYLRMFSLNREDFVFITFTNDYINEKLAAEKLVAANIIVYLKNNDVYIACVELEGYTYDGSSTEICIYEVKNESEELISFLKKYRINKRKGWQPILPEWREDISEFPKTYNSRQYALFFIIEFVVAVLILSKFFKDNKEEKVSAKHSKTSKKGVSNNKRGEIEGTRQG